MHHITGPSLEERHHRGAIRDRSGHHQRGRMVGDHIGRELHRDLRLALAVAEDEAHRPAVDAAFWLTQLLEGLEIELHVFADEGADAGHRRDDMDVIGLLGAQRRDAKGKRRGADGGRDRKAKPHGLTRGTDARRV